MHGSSNLSIPIFSRYQISLLFFDTSMKYRIDQISGTQFGTSGARGLGTDLTDQVCYMYTTGFLQYVRKIEPSAPQNVAVAGDLRLSTPRIMKAVIQAIADFGCRPLNCGHIPTPALAHYGITKKIPSIMITGSHISADRNGLKFHLSTGEIYKKDEEAIRAECIDISENLFDERGMFVQELSRKDAEKCESEAIELYKNRFYRAFPPQILQGVRLGLYEQSAVGRDILHGIYTHLGAKVTRLGRRIEFIPIDTEAVHEEYLQHAKKWSEETDDGPHDPVNPRFDAIVSTDADGDRALMFDENGQWIRGDILGILTARFLSAETVVTPVSSSSALERCKWFPRIIRTKIGSPYVAEAMHQAVEQGYKNVVGFEANGGFFTGQPILVDERAASPLSALPTRDAVIVHIAVLCMTKMQGVTISSLLEELPRRVVVSDRIKNISSFYTQQKLEDLILGGQEMLELTFRSFGELTNFNTTDGLRLFFGDNDIVHLRPSGNAPEFRCYIESDTKTRADDLLKQTMDFVFRWKIR